MIIMSDAIDRVAVVSTATVERNGMDYLYQRAISGTESMDDVKFPWAVLNNLAELHANQGYWMHVTGSTRQTWTGQ